MSKFYVWVSEVDEQIMSSSDFNAENQRIRGFASGEVISSKIVNSALRQANLVAVALMEALGVSDAIDLRSSVSLVTNEIRSKFNSLVDLNVLKGTGSGSIIQKNGGVSGSSIGSTVADAKAYGKSSIALNARTEVYGDCGFVQGYNSKSYNKGDAAFNSSKAGLSQSEFASKYPIGYLYDGSYLSFAEYNQRILGSNFACNKGNAKGQNTFSAGEHSSDHGSEASNSATFGFYCDTHYGEHTTNDGQGGTKTYMTDATGSICGGRYSTCSNRGSIVWGENLIAPPHLDPLQPSVIFGKYNKNWHDDEPESEPYKTIFELGNGTGNGELRHNAFVVTHDGRAKGFGEPKESNDFIRFKELNKKVPTPPHYTNSDNGTYVFKATVTGSGTDNYQVQYYWVKE